MAWVVLDFDGVVMRNHRPELFPQIKVLLQRVHAAGVPIFLCSFNRDARDILWATQLLPLFRETLCDAGGPKPHLICQLADKHNLSLAACRFFDDTRSNVDACQMAGIESFLVDPERGLLMKDLVDSGIVLI